MVFIITSALLCLFLLDIARYLLLLLRIQYTFLIFDSPFCLFVLYNIICLKVESLKALAGDGREKRLITTHDSRLTTHELHLAGQKPYQQLQHHSLYW